MQEENHIFKGLKRDNHQIKQDAESLWDAHNIRLTNRDDSTLLSITNEKGPSDTGITFAGNYVGHSIVGDYLVVFTSNPEEDWYAVYRVEKTDKGYRNLLIYHKHSAWDAGWTQENPIETIGMYETELVQKVYWIDGVNPPRVINVAMPELKFANDPESLTEFYENPGHFNLYKDSFDFVQTLQLKEDVYIEELKGNGLFAPGVIQYAFTYYDKYGAESNIFYTTPLQYITYPDRGGSPEDRIATSFKIRVDNVDNFDYVRVYSIHRTSIEDLPTVKIVSDVQITDDYIELIDTGTIGEVVDPTYLLYVGGRDIVPQCMTHKDGTLFFGNIELKEDLKFLAIKEEILKKDEKGNYINIELKDAEGLSVNYNNPTGTYYSYELHPEIRGFKSNEYYRLGIQFQKTNGTWTEPIYIDDAILNKQLPYYTDTTVQWYTKSVVVSADIIGNLNNAGYKKIRTCAVFPTVSNRTIICQGILCPTVFNVDMRSKDSPFLMSSWFMRPNMVKASPVTTNIGQNIQYVHNKALFASVLGAEIQGTKDNQNINGDSLDRHTFFVDENTLTFHSPEIEFDTSIFFLDQYSRYKLDILGFIELKAIAGDINIVTSSPVADKLSKGFLETKQGYLVGTPEAYINGGLVSGGFYEDYELTKDSEDNFKVNTDKGKHNYLVYPFHRSGSLNNDESRPENKGTRTAVLSKKIISNLKYFNGFTPIRYEETEDSPNENKFTFTIRNPQLFSSDVVTLTKIWINYLNKYVSYYGNVETAITFEDNYPIYSVGEAGKFVSVGTTNDPVSIKYKSTPHIVFSLGGDDSSDNSLYLPPISVNNIEEASGDYEIPDWDNTSKIEIPRDNSILDVGVLGAGVPVSDFKTGKYAMVLLNKDNPEQGAYLRYIEIVNPATGKVTYNSSIDSQRVVSGAIFRIKGNGTVKVVVRNGLINKDDIYDVQSVWENDEMYWVGVYRGEDKYFKITRVRFLYKSGNSTAPYSRAISFEECEPPEELDDIVTRGEDDTSFKVKREKVPTTIYNSDRPYLWLAELRREISPDIMFGGTSDYVLKSHQWYPTSKPVDIKEGVVAYTYGDTWYSRYDCLKTYPFTHEDQNQIVEIGSFMCETRINIDGRYDRNRGEYSNLQMTPQNFNLINEVYTTRDSYFQYKILDEDYYKNSTFTHQVTWSLEKHAGSDTDPWTQVTMANTLDMDGTKGAITKLTTFNENLICFQERALSTIQFNSRVQIPVTDGVPIEISNGQKVDGYRLLSGTIGCQNKWSVCNASTGLFFIDDNTDTLYAIGEGVTNMSDNLGMKWWFRENHSSVPWKPKSSLKNGIRAFYDPTYGDIYFTPGLEHMELQTSDGDISRIDRTRDAICYSEKLGQFVSQYSYGGVQAMLPFKGEFITLRDEDTDIRLWKNFDGEYNTFFNEVKGWDFSFISNENPTITKIFDTIELRADCFNPQLLGDKYSTNVQEGQPIDFIQASNEYQDTRKVNVDAHNLRKKFRIWRGQIPRNFGTRQRIRNPWTMITLGYRNPGTKLSVIHDVSVKYTL